MAILFPIPINLVKGNMSDRSSVDRTASQKGAFKEYVSPDPVVIREYARCLCQSLSNDNPTFGKREVISGLTEFLLFVAPLTAKYLNTPHRPTLLKGYTKNQVKRTRLEGTHG